MIAVRASLLFVLAAIGIMCAVSDGARYSGVTVGPHVRVIVQDAKGWPISGARVKTFDGLGHTDASGIVLVPTLERVHLVVSKAGYDVWQGYAVPGRDCDVTLRVAYRVN